MLNLTRGDYKGWAVVKKTAGSGPLAVGTQVFIPSDAIRTSSPVNTSYPLMINSDASISNAVLGRGTPGISIHTAIKGSWFTAALINSLIAYTNADGTTDTFAVGVFDGVVLRVFDGCKCPGITLSVSAAGGPIGLDIPFMALYDSAYQRAGQPSATTFTAPSGPDAGYLTPVSQVSFANTADQVTGVQLSLLRAQGYQAVFDQSLNMSAIGTGIATGQLSIAQYATATVVPSSGFVLQIGTAGAGVQFAGQISLDNPTRNYFPSFGSQGFTFSIVDLSGAGTGISITAM